MKRQKHKSGTLRVSTTGSKVFITHYRWKDENMEEKGDVADNFTFDTADLPDAIQDRLVAHGASVLLQQRTSQESGPEARMAGIRKYAEVLQRGEWIAERTGGQRGTAAEQIALAEVLAEEFGASVLAVQVRLGKYTPAERQAIAAKYAEQVQARIAQATGDAGELEF